jgi:chromosome segregation protein
MTAITLLFSIYQTKPSPFCILDEIDAPLDDVNVTRFTKLVEDYLDRSQFIIITHNKGTMEASNQIYGVTMEEKGVSRVVSIAFDGKGRPDEGALRDIEESEATSSVERVRRREHEEETPAPIQA